MVKNHNVFCIDLNRLPFIGTTLLDALTYKPFPVNWGVKREGYYIMNINNHRVNNFQKAPDVEAFNYLYQICTMKGYSLIMIKI